jgi:hypothetical protein
VFRVFRGEPCLSSFLRLLRLVAAHPVQTLSLRSSSWQRMVTPIQGFCPMVGRFPGPPLARLALAQAVIFRAFSPVGVQRTTDCFSRVSGISR